MLPSLQTQFQLLYIGAILLKCLWTVCVRQLFHCHKIKYSEEDLEVH